MNTTRIGADAKRLMLLLGIVSMSLALLAGPVAAAPVRKPGPIRVLLVGDSITLNYTPSAAAALRAQGYQVTISAIYGSSVLDARECKGTRAKHLSKTVKPDIVIQEYIGNYGFFPPCTPVVTVGSPAFSKAWAKSATKMTKPYTRRGARVHWVLNPTINRPNGGIVPGLNAIYRKLGTPTIDAWTAFGGATFNPALRKDYRHLNDAGAQLMANLVVAAVRR